MKKFNISKNNSGSDIIDAVLCMRRVSKVVKTGPKFSFSVLVAVGDGNGMFGFATASGREMGDAKSNAIKRASRSMVRVPLREGKSLHHDVKGEFSASRVVLRAAPPGVGIIAGGTIAKICECLGIQDIVAKSIGSSNPYNVVRATLSALLATSSPRAVAELRGVKSNIILSRRGG